MREGRHGGAGEGTAGRMAPSADMSFRQRSAGALNGLRNISNSHHKETGIHDDTRSRAMEA
jgi:hypothetical protein